eukprot:CAMPEP_0196208308 /NCGR_PEP_ID=MMETSP0912-20130531/8961_1 /TAXON_ID=49265 /ORGANISM="Thalassiosira rotula, Strain GSO102" /LENGTH=54 /DNA_ID=CAMNT_0041483083 /DNA_START=671 /DNA_END=835 /DNA_ORIENTATION=+
MVGGSGNDVVVVVVVVVDSDVSGMDECGNWGGMVDEYQDDNGKEDGGAKDRNDL